MGHGLAIIEEWISLSGWSIIMTAKSIGFFIAWKLLFIGEPSRSPLRKYLKSSIPLPKREIFVVVMFNLLLFILTGGIKSNAIDFNVYDYFISTIAVSVFYSLDFILLMFMLSRSRVNSFEKIAIAILIPLILLFSTKLTFVYEKRADIFVIFNFFMMFVLSLWPYKSLLNGFLFLLLFILPISVLTQYNIVWSDIAAVFHISNEFGLGTYFTAAFVSFGYLLVKRFGLVNIIRQIKLFTAWINGRLKDGKSKF
jgi:hypothetical protein